MLDFTESHRVLEIYFSSCCVGCGYIVIHLVFSCLRPVIHLLYSLWMFSNPELQLQCACLISIILSIYTIIYSLRFEIVVVRTTILV
jgi:hypothetical protein